MFISQTRHKGKTPLKSRTLDLELDLFLATRQIDPEYDMDAFIAEMIWLSEFFAAGDDARAGIYDQRDFFIDERNYLAVARVEAAICDFGCEQGWVNFAAVVGERARQYLGLHFGVRETAHEQKTVQISKALFERMLAGASIGGRKSGETRRAQSKIPGQSALAEARAILISQGHDPRRVASILAKRHGCTPEHIRTMLKKNGSA